MWEWSCAERQKRRSGIECADAPARWRWRAESGAPRRAPRAWGPKSSGPMTRPLRGFSSSSLAQTVAGCWSCLCCSPLPDWGCPFWDKGSVFDFLVEGSFLILSPALPRWPPVLLQGSWCRTPLLSFSCPLITFQPPTQKLDFVRFFIAWAYSFKKENKKNPSAWQACVSHDCWSSIGLDALSSCFLVTLLKFSLSHSLLNLPDRTTTNHLTGRSTSTSFIPKRQPGACGQLLLARMFSRGCGRVWNRQESRKCALAGRVIEKRG